LAFPYIFEANFETGDTTEWDSETDTGSQLSVESYKAMAKHPFKNGVPFTGASAMRLNVSGTADAFVLEGDIDYALDATGGVRFTLYIAETFVFTADDTIALFELQGAANAIQLSIGLRLTAATDLIEPGIGELAPTAFGSFIERGKWYTITANFNIDAGGNDGDASLFITKVNENVGAAVASVATLDQIAVIQGVLGIQDQLSTTTGDFFIGDFTADDARLFPLDRQDPAPEITKSGHLFVGRGCVDSATILSENADDSVDFFDTDDGDTNQVRRMELENGANLSISGPIKFEKGCFVSMAGASNPRAQAYMVDTADAGPGVFGPDRSFANIKRLGRQ